MDLAPNDNLLSDRVVYGSRIKLVKLGESDTALPTLRARLARHEINQDQAFARSGITHCI